MATHFCDYCGHGPVKIIAKRRICSDCNADYYIGKVLKRPNITEEEADLLFTKKELTERQKYGSVSKKRWRKKKPK